jgi:hypothetical protein
MNQQITYQYVDYIRCDGELIDAYFDAESSTLIMREGLDYRQAKEARTNAERDLARINGLRRGPGCSAEAA